MVVCPLSYGVEVLALVSGHEIWECPDALDPYLAKYIEVDSAH